MKYYPYIIVIRKDYLYNIHIILQGIEETAEETLMLVKEINKLLEKTAEEIRQRLPSIYSRELVDSRNGARHLTY